MSWSSAGSSHLYPAGRGFNRPPRRSKTLKHKRSNFLLDKQGGEGGDAAGYSPSNTPYLNIFFACLLLFKSPTVNWVFLLYFID